MFERLTHRSKYGIAYTKIAANESNMVDVGECYTGRIIDRLAAYEDSGLSPEEIISTTEDYKDVSQQYANFVHEMQPLKEAKAEGRLMVLPCKVGDAIWKIKSAFSYFTKPMEDRVERIIIYKNEILVCCTSGAKFSIGSVGKAVFLSREEAEKALEVGNP